MNAYYDLLTDTFIIEGIVFDASAFRAMFNLKVGGTFTLGRKADPEPGVVRMVKRIIA